MKGEQYDVVDRMDLPFVASPEQLDPELFWPRDHDEFAKGSSINDKRDSVLYPMKHLDTKAPLPTFPDEYHDQVWGAAKPENNPRASKYWDYDLFLQMIDGKVGKGKNGDRLAYFLVHVALWTQCINARIQEDPENNIGFKAEDSEFPSFAFIAEILNREKYSVYKCEKCLAVNRITKKGLPSKPCDIQCLCALQEKSQTYRAEPHSCIEWLAHSPKYLAHIPTGRKDLAIHIFTMYTPQDTQVTLAGLDPEAPRITLHELIRNPFQQAAYEVSAADVKHSNRSFLLSLKW